MRKFPDVGLAGASPRGPRHYRRLAAALTAAALTLAAQLSPERLVHAQPPPTFTQEVEARVVALVNDFRAEHGLNPLEREPRLDQAAQYFGGYMADRRTLEHTADGNTPAARVKQLGYAYCVIAENIAYEYSSRGFTAERLARNFVEGWRDSPTHRANMLDAAVTQTGLGVARSGKGEYYAAQIFGRPPILVPGAKKGAACRR